MQINEVANLKQGKRVQKWEELRTTFFSQISFIQTTVLFVLKYSKFFMSKVVVFYDKTGVYWNKNGNITRKERKFMRFFHFLIPYVFEQQKFPFAVKCR